MRDKLGEDRDMSDYSVLKRYRIANEHTIVGVVADVFASLMDIPRLVKERNELKERIKELEDANGDV